MANLGPANDWRPVLLGQLKAPVSSLNLECLADWAQSEGMNPVYNNPLATTEPGFGGTSINSQGVKHYPTPQAGGQATAKTLQNGRYGPIIAALRASKNRRDIWQAINRSPWCGGCQGGHYPIVLYNRMIGAPGYPGGPAGPPAPVNPPVRNVTENGWDYSPLIRDAAASLVGHAGHAEDAVRATRRQLGG